MINNIYIYSVINDATKLAFDGLDLQKKTRELLKAGFTSDDIEAAQEWATSVAPLTKDSNPFWDTESEEEERLIRLFNSLYERFVDHLIEDGKKTELLGYLKKVMEYGGILEGPNYSLGGYQFFKSRCFTSMPDWAKGLLPDYVRMYGGVEEDRVDECVARKGFLLNCSSEYKKQIFNFIDGLFYLSAGESIFA